MLGTAGCGSGESLASRCSHIESKFVSGQPIEPGLVVKCDAREGGPGPEHRPSTTAAPESSVEHQVESERKAEEARRERLDEAAGIPK